MQVRGRLGQAGNPAARQKLSHLLDAAQKGVALNPTAIPGDLLVFVSGVLETIVPAEVAAARKAEAAAQAASTGDGELAAGSIPPLCWACITWHAFLYPAEDLLPVPPHAAPYHHLKCAHWKGVLPAWKALSLA